MFPVSVFLLLLSLVGQNPASLPQDIEGKPLSELLKRWPDEYVRWIITEEERELYQSLRGEQEKLQFIEQFWARRDPTPETPQNEYRTEYLQRFAYVLRRFPAGKPGWATDRGRIYLLLGSPHSIQQNPMGRYSLERPSEIWTYNNLPIPGIPASLDITFVDFKGTGDYEIVSDLESTAPVLTQLGTAESNLLALAMRRGYLGMEDPRTGRERFKEVDSTRLAMREFDLQQQLRRLEDPRGTLPRLDEVVKVRISYDQLPVRAVVGILHGPENRARIPVALVVPYPELTPRLEEGKAVYQLDYLIQCLDLSGVAKARVQDSVTISLSEEERRLAESRQLAVEELLEVGPGRYKLQVILRDGVRNRVGVFEQGLLVPARPGAGLFLSSLFLAGALVQTGSSADRPFQFGKVRVVPSIDGSFYRDQSLNLYLQAYGAAVGAAGERRVKVDFFIMREGRLGLGVPAAELASAAEPVGISASIPLRKCEPGEYVIRVRVTDQVGHQSAEQEARFTVQE